MTRNFVTVSMVVIMGLNLFVVALAASFMVERVIISRFTTKFTQNKNYNVLILFLNIHDAVVCILCLPFGVTMIVTMIGRHDSELLLKHTFEAK